MLTMTKRLEFDYGHRLQKHEGKCANYHGHRGAVEIECSAIKGLDLVGRVIDFSVVKELVGGWIDVTLDHKMILEVGDPMIEFLGKEYAKIPIAKLTTSPGLYIVNFPPTAEHLANMLFDKAQEILIGQVVVRRVRFYETPTSWAEVRP